MAGGAPWRAELTVLEPSEWPRYVTERSGLPGPRANLALVEVVANLADAAAIQALLSDGGEYPTMCAAAALGRRADETTHEAEARVVARDERWRVREGVAIGLQLLGARMPTALASVVGRWIVDPDPLVQRAAIAAICEPRLLRTPEAAALAVAACVRATRTLAETPSAQRRRTDIRTLRQALGYCWSVAIAADPEPGLLAFRSLDTADPDVDWVVKENRRKKRLAVLL